MILKILYLLIRNIIIKFILLFYIDHNITLNTSYYNTLK